MPGLTLSRTVGVSQVSEGKKSFQRKKAMCAKRCVAVEEDLETRCSSLSWHNGCEWAKGKVRKSCVEYWKEFGYFPESKGEVLKGPEQGKDMTLFACSQNPPDKNVMSRFTNSP